MGGVATYPNAVLAERLALLLRVAGSNHAVFGYPCVRDSFGYVQA